MKKIFALLMALSLLLTMLVGCGSEETPTTAATEATAETTEATAETTEATTETTEATTETTEATTETTEATTEAATEATTESSSAEDSLIGLVEDNNYINAKAGFGLALGDTWYVYNEEEIAALMGFTVDMFSDESVKSLVESSGTAIVFYTMDPTTGNNVNIAWEKIGLIGILMNADSYIDNTLKSLDSMLATAGFANIVSEKTTVSFAGDDHPAIALSAEVSGIPVYEVLVPIICGNYLCLTTITTVNTNTCADILTNFYALD